MTIGLSTDSGKDLISFTSAGRVTTSAARRGRVPQGPFALPRLRADPRDRRDRSPPRSRPPCLLVAERNTPPRFEVTDGLLTLHAGTGDDAQASEAVEAVLEGEPITVGFNPHYIAEGLAAIENPYVNFSFTQPMKPVIISGQKDLEASADESYRYLLMPTRI